MTDRVVDAILVARSIFSSFPSLVASRFPVHGDIAMAASQHQRGIYIYEEGGETNFLAAAKQMACAIKGVEDYPVEIVFRPLPNIAELRDDDGNPKSPEKIIRSVVMHYKTHAKIFAWESLNPCWKRFAICKELSQIVMDSENGGPVAEAFADQVNMMKAIGSYKHDTILDRESFSMCMAIELMFPFQERLELMERERAGEDRMSIAKSYWAPKAIVDIFFDTPFASISNSIA